MKKLLIILFLIPGFLEAQTSYDRNTQNPKIDASTTKNTSQDATIKKLIADTVSLSKRISALETTAKAMQASIATMGTQIAALTGKFQDSIVAVKSLITTNSIIPDSSQFKVINKILSIREVKQ